MMKLAILCATLQLATPCFADGWEAYDQDGSMWLTYPQVDDLLSISCDTESEIFVYVGLSPTLRPNHMGFGLCFHAIKATA
jgi:hypothetical protein